MIKTCIPIVNCWTDSSIDLISDFFISTFFEVGGKDGIPESVVNGSSSWADTSGLEITCSWVEIILEVEVIEPADVRVQGCVLDDDDDDVAVLVTVDLLQIDSSCGGWVGVCGCCCGWFPLPSNFIFLIIFKS